MTPITRSPAGLAAFVLSTAAALAVATTGPLDAQQRETRERHVYVGVTANDAPVTDLQARDFVIREDGIAREVLRVTPAPPPSHLALLVDDSESSRPLIMDLRTALAGFVSDVLGLDPSPHVALVTFGERPTRVVTYSPTLAMLDRSLSRIFAKTNSGSYFLQTVIEESAELRKLEAPRPVMVAFVIEAGPEFSNDTHTRVGDALRAANASLWTVALQSGSGAFNSTEGRERAMVLTDVAELSGGHGRAILSRQGISSALSKVLAEISSRYDVVYGRPDALIPPTRLQVEVRREGTRVSAPAWPGR